MAGSDIGDDAVCATQHNESVGIMLGGDRQSGRERDDDAEYREEPVVNWLAEYVVGAAKGRRSNDLVFVLFFVNDTTSINVQ